FVRHPHSPPFPYTTLFRSRRCVAPFQPYLVCAQPVKLEKEVLIELDPALSVCIDLHHPTLYTIRIELLIPRRVERVRKVDALAIDRKSTRLNSSHGSNSYS